MFELSSLFAQLADFVYGSRRPREAGTTSEPGSHPAVDQLKQWARNPQFDLDGVIVKAIRDGQACAHCLEKNGTYYQLEEALKAQPLPHEKCTNNRCRCHYLPVRDETDSDRL